MKSMFDRCFIIFSLQLMLVCPIHAWAAPSRRVNIGNGSGYLSHPDAKATLNLQPGDTLYINPGVYSGLSLGNLSGTAARPITVKCDPQAAFTTATPQSNTFPNIAHVRFEDFRFEIYKSTCLKITGQSHDVLFKNFHLKDVSGYSFYIYDATKVFDGTRESTFYNFKWENVVIDGKTDGAAICNLNYSLSNLVSVVLDFEIYRCTFRNFDNTQQAFPVIGLERCFNLEVHECTFSDIGMAESPIGHNVCIAVAGFLSAHNNKFTRQWANDVRVWPNLVDFLRQMSGAEVEVVVAERRERPTTGEPAVVLGDLALKMGLPKPPKTISGDGYCLKTQGSHLLMAGESPDSTRFAVTHFLEKMGCRWFMPNQWGEIIPERKTISLDGWDIRETPDFVYRNVWAFVPPARARLGGMNLPNRHDWQHVPAAKHFQDHPEYYALRDGERRPGKGRPINNFPILNSPQP